MMRFKMTLLVALLATVALTNALPSNVNPATSTLKEMLVSAPSAISAFERIEVSGLSGFYGARTKGNEEEAMVWKNVGFGVTGASRLSLGVNAPEQVNGQIEFRLGSPKGKLISSVPLSAVPGQAASTRILNGSVVPVKGFHDLYLSYSGDVKTTNVSWFQFEVSGPNPEEFYVLTSQLNGQALSAFTPDHKGADNTRVSPYGYGLHQMFSFVKNLVGSYFVKARHSGYYLQVQAHQFNDSAYVHLQPFNSSAQSQEWYIDPVGAGGVKIMSRLSGKCVSLIPNNLYLRQMPCMNESSQKWNFMPVC